MTAARRRAGLALPAGLAALLLIGALVTEVLSARIEFSAILGLPAGVVAGLAAFAFTYTWLGTAPGSGRRGIAVGSSVFGALFLAALVVGVAGLGVRPSRAIPLAVGLGLVGAAVAATRERRADRGRHPR